MINQKEIINTIAMIDEDFLDIRTITMGISLIDCISKNQEETIKNIKYKIKDKAKNLVAVANKLSSIYGVPVINKRISVTPISIIYTATKGDPVLYAKCLDECAEELGIDFIGGYSALVSRGFAGSEKEFILSIPKALATTKRVCSSVNVGSTKNGINLDAVKIMGEIIREAAILTKDQNCMAAAKFVVFCNSVEDNPFMAGAYHGINQGDCVINVGISGPGVVRKAVAELPLNASINEVYDAIKKTAFKITRIGNLIGRKAAEMLKVPFNIVDISLAPTPLLHDSVAEIIEAMGLETCGTHGTTACLAMLNDAIKKGGVMAADAVGGLSGSFIPVSEDAGMIKALEKDILSLEKLEAMTAVCSVGIDMVVVSGNTSSETIAGIIADEMAIGMVNNKTTAVRLIPAIGLKEGEELDFGGLLGHAPIIKTKDAKCDVLINRGGQIPAPMHSLKN